MTTEILTFDQALLKTKDQKRHLLLGNGFSVALRPDIFSYRSMTEKSKHLSEDLRKIFKGLNIVDFEEVIRSLESAHKLCEILGKNSDFGDMGSELRNALVETIADHHPNRPSSISEPAFESCVKFLKNFGGIYSLNYDMLLYWVMMRDSFTPGRASLLKAICYDGFTYDDEREFLNWERTNDICVRYLHGALHLFENIKLEKLNYSKELVPLKEQFTNLIFERNKLPLFVTEGDSDKKLARINRSPYLLRCLDSLLNIGTSKAGDALFIYGASLSTTDDHIIATIAKNKCPSVYVGIYGPQDTPENLKLIERASNMTTLRKASGKSSKIPLKVQFFNSADAKVWG